MERNCENCQHVKSLQGWLFCHWAETYFPQKLLDALPTEVFESFTPRVFMSDGKDCVRFLERIEEDAESSPETDSI